ncbi:protein shisa-5-like [Ischnura elegans]|uniref:protein shisa-5-like n=1 Tax=Ischnura elegans TaxID=197161 RepID=UPI001ED87CA2|nr:protein shisa-5-like [Ischnura elegans]
MGVYIGLSCGIFGFLLGFFILLRLCSTIRIRRRQRVTVREVRVVEVIAADPTPKPDLSWYMIQNQNYHAPGHCGDHVTTTAPPGPQEAGAAPYGFHLPPPPPPYTERVIQGASAPYPPTEAHYPQQ